MMAQSLVQLRSKKQQNAQPLHLPVSSPYAVPSTLWIYRMKAKILFLTLFYAFRSKHPWAAIRRYFMAIVAPQSYLTRFRRLLEGECNRCGHCCRLLFDCPFLAQEPGGPAHCTIYMTRHAPKICVLFPLNPEDLAEIKRAIAPNQCSFSFASELEEKVKKV